MWIWPSRPAEISFERVGVKTSAVGVLRWCKRVPRCLLFGFEAVLVDVDLVSFCEGALKGSVDVSV